MPQNGAWAPIGLGGIAASGDECGPRPVVQGLQPVAERGRAVPCGRPGRRSPFPSPLSTADVSTACRQASAPLASSGSLPRAV